MDVIKIKRGLNTDLNNAVLQTGEPAFTLDTKKLYIFDGNSKVLINPTNIGAFTNDVGYIKATDNKTIDGGVF